MHGRAVFGVAPAVAGYEIVVAAANNLAVENVATVLNHTDAVSGHDVRTHLAGPGRAGDADWWALIAVILGNRRNVRATRVLVPDAPAPDPWPGWLQGEPSWPQARHAFEAAWTRVERIVGDVAARADRIARLRRELPHVRHIGDHRALVEQARREEAHRAEAVVDDRATRPGELARLFGSRRWAAWASAHQEACASRDTLRRLVAELEDDPSPNRNLVVDGETWLAMDDEIFRERSPPGIDDELERARADLFVRALEVHGAALATRAPVIGSTLSTWAWSLDAPNSFTTNERRALWRSAFVVVPVVTTTFASAGRMLEAFGLDDLGCAVIDEAGQASGHQAVPLLSKVRRALVVGDQQQLQPVVTLDHTVERAVMRAAGADERLAPDQASVQHLADAGSLEGARIAVGTTTTWVGIPLRGHFRCADPMFGIANAISYGDTMIRLRDATPARPGAGGLVTQWIDVQLASGGHWSVDDERALAAILSRFAAPPNELFVIAPFRRAIAGARYATIRMVRDRGAPAAVRERWRSWTTAAIGTVHTFQGREADTVVLLLSAADRPRARAWAASPPNLLNVAVTRAREHLIVIGKRAAWSTEPNAAEIVNRVRPAGWTTATPPWLPPTPV